MTHLADYDPDRPGEAAEPTLADRWILSRMNRTIAEVRRGLDAYKFNEAASALYQFLWHEFCDWYVELVKPALYQEEDPGRKRTAQKVLSRVLETALRLLHPFMPFITEEIWQNLPKTRGSIMVADFPRPEGGEVRPGEEAEMDLIMSVIGAIRNLRSEMEIPPGKKAEVILYSPNPEALRILEQNRMYIENLARTEKMTARSDGEKPRASATAVVGEVEVFVPLKGLINLEDEQKRLEKELSKISGDLSRTRVKLQNQDFLTRAKPEAVEKEREKSRTLAEREGKLREGLERIRGWMGESQ